MDELHDKVRLEACSKKTSNIIGDACIGKYYGSCGEPVEMLHTFPSCGF